MFSNRGMEQFRKVVPLSRRWLWSVFWADRRPLPPSGLGPMVQPSDNVGPFGGWEDATLEDDDRVRFPGSRPRAVKIVLWTHFLVMWRHHQSPQGPLPPPTASRTDVKTAIEKHGPGTEKELMKTVSEALPNRHVPREWVRQARDDLFGKPGRTGRPKSAK